MFVRIALLQVAIMFAPGSVCAQIAEPVRIGVAHNGPYLVIPALPRRPRPDLARLPERARPHAQALREVEIEIRALLDSDDAERRDDRLRDLSTRRHLLLTELIEELERSSSQLDQVGWLELAEARFVASATAPTDPNGSDRTTLEHGLSDTVEACRYAQAGPDSTSEGWARLIEAQALSFLDSPHPSEQIHVAYRIAIVRDQDPARLAAIWYGLADEYRREGATRAANAAYAEAATIAERIRAFDIWSTSRLRRCELALTVHESPLTECLRMFEVPEDNAYPVAGQGSGRLRLIARAMDRGIPEGALDAVPTETRTTLFRALSAFYQQHSQLERAAQALEVARDLASNPDPNWTLHLAELEARQLIEEPDSTFARRVVTQCMTRARPLKDFTEFVGQNENARTIRFAVRYGENQQESHARISERMGDSDAAEVMRTCLREPVPRPHGPAARRQVRGVFVLDRAVPN